MGFGDFGTLELSGFLTLGPWDGWSLRLFDCLTFWRLDFWTLGLWDFGAFRLWDFGTFGLLDFGTF